MTNSLKSRWFGGVIGLFQLVTGKVAWVAFQCTIKLLWGVNLSPSCIAYSLLSRKMKIPPKQGMRILIKLINNIVKNVSKIMTDVFGVNFSTL